MVTIALLSAGCGGSVAELGAPPPGSEPATPGAPTAPGVSTPPTSDVHVDAPEPPPRPTVECGARVVGLDDRDRTLYGVDPTTGATTKRGVATCLPSGEVAGIVLRRTGDAVALSRDGALTVVNVGAAGQTTCTARAPLPPSTAGYGTLAFDATGALVAFARSSALDHAAGATYHHELVTLDPTTFATTATRTLDIPSWPDGVHPLPNGDVVAVVWNALWRWSSGDPTPTKIPVADLSLTRATVAIAGDRLFAIGDVHHGTGNALPTYGVAIANGALSAGPALQTPKGALGLVLGNTACTYDP